MKEKKDRRPKTKTLFLLAFFALSACQVMKGSQSNAQTDEQQIQFLVFSIHQETKNALPVLKLISKSAGGGMMKQKAGIEPGGPDYLSIYIYHDRRLLDSLRIEHPLYKHLEYVNADNSLSMKDTVIDKAEFFVRFQTEVPATELRIHETLKRAGTRQIASIKL